MTDVKIYHTKIKDDNTNKKYHFHIGQTHKKKERKINLEDDKLKTKN